MSLRRNRGVLLSLAIASCNGPAPLPAIAIPAGDCEVLRDLKLWDAADESVQLRAAQAVDFATDAFRLLELRTFAANDRSVPDGPGQMHRIAVFEHSPTGMHFVLIPGGTYTHGAAPPADPTWPPGFHHKHDGPQHLVTLTQPFLFCRTEVPRHIWDAVPGFRSAVPTIAGADPCDPVAGVSSDSADAWCRAIDLELPTEAEWEYAARGSSVGNHFYSAYDRYTRYKHKPGLSEPRPAYVGSSGLSMQTAPNAFGVFDASVGLPSGSPEWTVDYDGPYPADAVVDPRTRSGRNRVFRDPNTVFDAGGALPVWKRGSRSWDRLLTNYVRVRAMRRLAITPQSPR